MIKKLKSIATIFALFFTTTALAQLEVKPLERNSLNYSNHNKESSQLNKKKAGQTLILPFFEDFLYGPGYPDTNNWVDNQVYINNDFGLNPPSYGVATFDHLNANGNPWYPFSQFATGPADTLTSQFINLKDSGGVAYRIADSIYLSFFYQSKGLGDLSKTADSLFLQFKNRFGTWTTVWRTAGGGMGSFKQVLIPLVEDVYLHESFQFRFTAYTHQWGNNNQFHLDYIFLNKNRRFNQLGFDDYAVCTPPTSLLKVYSNMPYDHFLKSPNDYTADSIYFNVSNLSANVLNIEVKHKETSGGSTLIETNPVTNAANVPAFGFSTRRFVGIDLKGLVGKKVTIERSYELREPSVLNPYRDNDKIELKHTFDNYYSYDDGTAEAGFGFNDLLKGDGSIAVKYNLAKSDTLRAISVFFNQSVKDVSRVNFTLNVWTKLTLDPVYQFVNSYATYTGKINGFYDFILDSTIVLPAGEVYVGWQQTGNYNLNVGLDRNNGYIANKGGTNKEVYYKVGDGDWSQNNDGSINGSPMMRLVVGETIAPVVGINQPNTIKTAVYPNPCNNRISIEHKGDFSYQLSDLKGTIIANGVGSESIEINTTDLLHGIYFVIVKDKSGSTAYSKLIKQ
jgi:hypothetical protein